VNAFQNVRDEDLLDAALRQLRDPRLAVEDGLSDLPLEDRPVGTDLRNMERLRDYLDGAAIWSDAGAFVWSGTHWRADKNVADAQAHKLSRILYREMRETVDLIERAAPNERRLLNARVGEYAKAIQRAESKNGIQGPLDLLKRELRIDPSRLDADSLLFNVTNGTIDLRDGSLRNHDPADWITKVAPVTFDINATCPRFLQFLNEVFVGDSALISYLQRYVGYCLTGMTSEHVISVWHGMGANGKSTLVNLLLAMMGDYAGPLDVTVLEGGYGRDASRDALRVVGQRFVVASESREGMKLAEGFVKQLTGGDALTGRALYGEAFKFVPTHKLALVTNHRPTVEGTDHAIWRRIALLPFEATFDAERADRDLGMKLRAELPGILNWAIAGCLEWQTHGLDAPQRVKEATSGYRTDEDVLAQFLGEEFVCSDPRAVTDWRDVVRIYNEWCNANGLQPLSGKKLGMRLRERWGATAFGKGKGGRSTIIGHALREAS